MINCRSVIVILVIRRRYELVMLVLFVLAFLFWIVAALDVRINGQRDLERKYWHKYDPTLIAEGTFCFATIMAFFKLLFICQLDYDLGPLQLSLVKMIRDVGHFIAIFGIIIMAYTIGKTHVLIQIKSVASGLKMTIAFPVGKLMYISSCEICKESEATVRISRTAH